MNRKDLATIIEQQKEQLFKYEIKLRDVVRAYKALQKERDALQAAVSAIRSSSVDAERLTPSPSNSSLQAPDDVDYGGQSEQKVQQIHDLSPSLDVSSVSTSTVTVASDTTASSKQIDAPVSSTNSPTTLLSNFAEQAGLQKQLERLTLAVSDMSAEKEALKKGFLLERKRMTEEKGNIIAEKNRLAEEARTACESSKELKMRIQQLQRDRDADADDAALRLRECERLLSEERAGRERTEIKLQQTQHKLLHRSQQQKQQQVVESQHQQQLKTISELKNAICQLEARLGSCEEQLKSKENELTSVQQLHAASATALRQESCRAQEAEAELNRALIASREREAGLEAKLAEAAACMAASASMDVSSSASLHHYKIKVQELTEQNQDLQLKLESALEDEKNTLENVKIDLADSFNVKNLTSSSVSSPQGKQDAEQLVKQLRKLWLQLQLLPLAADLRSELESMLGGGDLLHESCRQQQTVLMQQMVQLQSTSSSSESSDKEENETLCRLRDELRNATTAAQVTEAAHTAQISQLKQELRSMRAECEERVVSIQQSHRAVVCSLEQQLTSQRLHSLATLQERDIELNKLQQQIHTLTADVAQAPAALLSSASAAARAGPLLHHVQELQRREQEVTALQQEKRQLEQTLREVQQTALERRMQQEDRLTILEMQIERFSRNQSRESQNLEYLKNVLLHFLTTPDSSSLARQAMVKAVAAVLKLTDNEEERLRRAIISKPTDSWWWWRQDRQ